MKVKAVKEFPRPVILKDLRSFLGLTSYYRRFVKDYAKISHPLYKLLAHNMAFIWDDACQESFDRLKEILTSEPVLRMPDFDKPFKLQTDASDRGLRAVLSQDWEGKEYPIAYASRTLSPAKLKWDAREKEALAIIWASE